MPRNTLWGYTRYQTHQIAIYQAPMTDNYLGWTNWQTDKAGKAHMFEIHITPETWESPADWEEVLIHEFIHVLEEVHGPRALSHVLKGNCTRGATVLGHGLAVMLRELRQNGIEA